MATPNIPVVNAGELYVTGLRLTNDSTAPNTTVNIATGQARDSTNANDIVVSTATSCVITSSGAGGLDTGTVAANTFYAVYILGDSTGYNDPIGMFSLSATSPVLPGGYDMFRRVGYALTDGSSHILAFDQTGSGKDRPMVYRASIATDITNGSSATFAAVDVSDSIPKAGVMGIFKFTFTPTGANDEAALRSGNSATDEGQAVMNGVAAGVVTIGMLYCPVGSTLASGVDYKVTGASTAINVQGYVDEL